MKDQKLKTLLNKPEVATWRSVMHCFKTVFTYLEQGLVDDSCSVSRFEILFILYFEPKTSAVDLSRKMHVTRGNISTFLKRVENDQLVKKSIPEGRKRPVYELTPKGRHFFEKIFPEHIKRIQEICPTLSPATIKKLNSAQSSSHS